MPSKREARSQQGMAAAEPQEETTAMTAEEYQAKGYGFNLGNIPQDKRLIRNPDGTISIGKFILAPVGLIIREGAPVQQKDWEEIGDFLEKIEGSIQWLLGDWLVYGTEREWGETYRKAAEKSGRDITTIYDYAKVAGKVKFKVRTLNLTFGHHKLVANDKLTDEEKSDWLQRAVQNHWSVAQMREVMNPGGSKPALVLFENAGKSFWRKIESVIQNASADERRDMAAQLRSLADQIEQQ